MSAKILLRDTLLGESLLDLQAARLTSAEENVTKAMEILPSSQAAQFVAAEVFAALGRYSDSVKLFSEILGEENLASSVNGTALTQEQLAMTLIWKVVVLFLNGNGLSAGRLALYARSGTWEARALRDSLEELTHIPGLKPSIGELIAEGAIQTDSTWPREVANYLLYERTEAQLRNFAASEKDSDPRSPISFECSVEFYAGLKDLWRHRKQEAKTHFQNAVNTRQTELLEYWLAQSQLSSSSKRR